MSTVSPISQESHLSEPALRFLRREHRMLIGGEWSAASDGKRFPVVDPATEETIAEVPEATGEDVDRAVSAARRAFERSDWSHVSPVERERRLLRLADLVEKHGEELAQLETLENGKSLEMAREVDVSGTVDVLRYMAGWARKLEGETLQPSETVPGRRLEAYTIKEPVGVVGAIIPWNFPLPMVAFKMAPALAVGCTMVLKPAEETPLTALRLGELLVEAGYESGVVNIVTGHGDGAGAALANHPGLDKIAFTGSTEVGKRIGHAAMENLTRVSLELGGKSPVIVLDDVDPGEAAEGAAMGIFPMQGQVCLAGSRLYVHRSRYDDVVEGLGGIASGMSLGSGFEPGVDLNPLVSENQYERVLAYIEQGRKQGAVVVAGGAAGERPGYYIKPTVLTDLDERSSVVQEEIFGPVINVMPFDDLDEAAARANDSAYGLAASIWSNDLSRVHRLIPKIRAGTVYVNCHGMLDPVAPFGGYKHSGIGRELGRQGVELYTETKTVFMAV